MAKGSETASLKLADQGYHWVGLEMKKVDYGTILVGPMYYQYLIPQQVKHPYNVVLVHGGGGQGTHYFGRGDGEAGWAHYFVQAGYKTYIVDRPGQGRPPWFQDSLGDDRPGVHLRQRDRRFQARRAGPQSPLDRHGRRRRSAHRSIPGRAELDAHG